MKLVTAMATAVIFSITSVECIASGLPCRKIDYAELKDMDKKELRSAYCGANSQAQLNRDLHKISEERLQEIRSRSGDSSAAFKEMQEAGDAEGTCLEQMSTVEGILKRKFKSAPPTCR